MATPDVFSGSLSRRDLLKLGAQGALGIAAWATIGCGDNNPISPTQTSRKEPAQASSRLDTVSSPPEGFRAFRSTYFPYETSVPSDSEYLHQSGRDMFILHKSPNSSINMEIHPITIDNPRATVDDYAQRVVGESRTRGLETSVILPSSVLPDVSQQKLIELSKIRIDGKDTRLIFSKPSDPRSIFNTTSISAFIVDNGKAWHITTGFINATPTDAGIKFVSDKMGTAMKSFRLLK